LVPAGDGGLIISGEEVDLREIVAPPDIDLV
jgi:hypothetical protein